MKKNLILFNKEGYPRTSEAIIKEISVFKNDYINTTSTLILDSTELSEDGETFVKNGSLILSKFGMNRGGPFLDKQTTNATLHRCWKEVGEAIISIKQILVRSNHSRNRLLLEMERNVLESVTRDTWKVMKQILPFTMGVTTYGLVGASKLLFAVFPELVLPIDNMQWLKVFQTVDMGDVIIWMASDILHWEQLTGERLNELDKSGRLSTLPSVYNVMAMAARNY
jgi:hypothetical protein